MLAAKTESLRLKQALSNKADWPYILQQSKKEGVSCLLHQSLSEAKDNPPEEIRIKCREIYYRLLQRNIFIYHKIGPIFSALHKENIKFIPLKGIFLAEKIYENIGLRAISDIDLLIKKEDLPKIDNLLEDLGYRICVNKKLFSRAFEKSYMHSVDYSKQDGKTPPLHIHWHIVNVTLPTYMYTKDINMHRFFECARPAKLADAQTWELRPDHLLIYLCEHAVKHSFDRLILLSDIDAAIKKYKGELNWQELITEAKNLGMQRQVYYGLYFTGHFLDSDIPDEILKNLRPERLGLLEEKFFRAVYNNRRNTKLSYFVYLAMVKGVVNKFRFVFRTLFPPPSVLALTFNLNKPRVTLKDYFSFLKKQFSHLKKLSN